MEVLTADGLLLGPRGRGLCLAVAQRLSERVGSACQRSAETADPSILVRALQMVDPTPVSAWRDPLVFVEPMNLSVENAWYTEPPNEEDVLAADPDVVAALRPIAEAIASCPAAGWWSTPLDQDALRYTSRYGDDDPPYPPPLTGASGRLRHWCLKTVEEERSAAAEVPSDPSANYSGSWWSVPWGIPMVTTTRPLPGLGSVVLVWEEDTFDQDCAAIWPLATTRIPRVWEIDGPGAWTRLVDRYPLVVTHARRHDWYRTTGRAGIWRIPDWYAVSADWDAVHLSVAGYLTTATRTVPLADGEAATVLAGCDPDQTWWLNDILSAPTAPAQWWRSRSPGSYDPTALMHDWYHTPQ